MEYILFYLKYMCLGVLAILWYRTIKKYNLKTGSRLSPALFSIASLVPLMRLFLCWYLINRIARFKTIHFPGTESHESFGLYANMLTPYILFDIGSYVVVIVGIILIYFTGNYILIDVGPYIFIGAFCWLLYGFRNLWHTINHARLLAI